LAGIWSYTERIWGPAQADRYVRGLDALFRALAEGRASSRSAGSVREGYRRAAYGAHVAYFRESGTAIEVVRVLHARMDAASHLP
jgi:toxin ParE1/3/4